MRIFIVLSLILFFLAKVSLAKPDFDNSKPVLLKADKIDYFDKETLAVATGSVEISQGDKIVIADKVIYNSKTNTVTATGNVRLVEESGNVVFADEMELRDDLKLGVIEKFSARLKDGSVMIANNARIIRENYYELDKGVYTSCPVCDNKEPQWQIKAHKVVIDKEQKKVSYRNAFFEIYGVPVLYTPYFYHPTSDAERKNGILTPRIGSNSNIGNNLKVPYYINIADNKEAIIAPIFTSKVGTIVTAEYNHLTKYGLYNIEGSFNKNKNYKMNPLTNKKYRYHVSGFGNFQLNNNWLTGYDFTEVSDKEYLREYDFKKLDFLTSKAYLQHNNGRNQTSIKAINFKRLHPDPLIPSNSISYLSLNPDNIRTPFIFPYINSHIETNVHENGSKFSLDSNLIALERKKGTKSNRITLTGNYEIPYLTSHGSLFKLTASLRNDLYKISDLIYRKSQDEPQKAFNGTLTRVLPEARIDWRLPLVQKFSNNKMLIEPIANIIVSPNLRTDYRVPDEDSTEIEISDGNIFKPNHFPGFDRIETGPRTNYGLSSTLFTSNGAKLNALVGQNYRLKTNNYFTPASGMAHKASDYVGRLTVTPIPILDLYYRFRLNRADFAMRRNELGTTLNMNKLHFNINYITLQDRNEQSGKKQIFTSSQFHLTNKWSIGAHLRKNLSKKEKSMIGAGGNIIYSGDCIDIVYSFNKDFTKDPFTNRKGAITQKVNFSLKNLSN